jgi:hypothetical protein
MNWEEKLLERVQERNKKETYPFIAVYSSNEALYKENITYDTNHSQTLSQLALLHHELNESMLRGDYQVGCNLCYQKLYLIEEELRRKQALNPDSAEEDKVMMTRLISSLKKKISNQSDEIDMAKSELKVYQERILSLEAERERLKQAMMMTPSRVMPTQQPSSKDRRTSSSSSSSSKKL